MAQTLPSGIKKFDPTDTVSRAAFNENWDTINGHLAAATSAATANTIAKRDAAGRMKVAAPAAADDVARKAEIDAHANKTDNPHSVTKAQVGLGSTPNYPAATQAQAETGTDNASLMTPIRTKQYVDKRLQGDLTLRYNEGNVEAFNGTEWVSVGGDPTLNNYFGQYGTFPFAGEQDVTISSNTTWGDAAGFRRIKKLTINAGVTLRINKTPFFIFAEEIVFGSSTSTIDASGPNGAATGDFPDIFANGGTAVSDTARAQGGCGGGILFVVTKTFSGANGKIKANGGNGYSNPTGSSSGRARSGQGAFGALNTSSTASTFDFLIGLSATNLALTGVYIGKKLNSILGDGGGGVSGGKGGSSGGVNPQSAGGGSGIGGGGGSSFNGALPPLVPSLNDIFLLAELSCRGGGGGAAAIGSGTVNNGNGGGGGAVVAFSRKFNSTPTLEANGGSNSATGNGDGAAGVTFQVQV